MDGFTSLEGHKKISKEYERVLEELYSYYKKVMVLLIRQGLSYEDAQDAAQDTYIEAISYLHTLKNQDCMKIWLFTIARRVGGKYISRKNSCREREESIEDYDSDKNLALAISNEEIIDEAIGISKNQVLYKNLIKLDNRERKILLLHYIFRYDYKRIAEIFDMNLSTTRSVSRRAKEKLRRLILEERETL